MNVNVTKTKEYYTTITDSKLCDCGYCRNYRLQIKSVLPEVATYLGSTEWLEHLEISEK